MKKRCVFNKDGHRGTESMIFGNTTNLREWNRIRYSWANHLYKNMMNNFWIPEEISLFDDKKQIDYLTKEERTAFNKIISFLNFLDSIQSENLPNIAKFITAPEVCSLLNIQTFQEEIHAKSYSYILDTLVDGASRDSIYDEWRNDKVLFGRNEYIASIYEEFNTNNSLHNFIKILMANYILEGIYFYSGFSFFYTLARQGKMTNTSTILKYINRDEITHLVLFQRIIQEMMQENSDLFTDELKNELIEMMRIGVENEIQWGQYVTNGAILGINNDLIDKYIKYLANIRLSAIGLDILYPEIKENPMEWIDNFSQINNTKTDFFEQKVINYSKSGAFDFDALT